MISFRTLEEFAESIQAGFDHLSILVEPRGLRVQAPRAQPARPDPPNLLAGHEAGSLEDVHVLLEPREGDLELRGEVADRRVASSEVLEDAAPRRVRKRRKCAVDLRQILNHMVHYSGRRMPLSTRPDFQR
jgi:hypothetical protein